MLKFLYKTEHVPNEYYRSSQRLLRECVREVDVNAKHLSDAKKTPVGRRDR
eukprot:m.423518 g.423518  ORF g.423518 m.423518 type:complete len:51 (+) comp20211_c4_seq10:276-428(+)